MSKKDEALKLALEALEDISSHYMSLPKKGCMALAAIEEALAEQPAQQQEPMAWMHNNIEGNVIAHRPIDIDRHPERWTALYPEPKPCPTCEALARTVMMDQTAHDTPPASKPLTDEFLRKLHHIEEFKLFCDYDDFEQIARAIEAAHGIKGDA